MISIVLAMLVASMDTTIANTTMGAIAGELGGMRLYAWSFASYMVMSTVVAPIAGRISDLYGRKTIFAAGILLFLVASILCGMSETMLQLVLFRAVQGIGAGIMMPFPAIIAGDLYPVEKRGKIQALFSAMWGLSAVLAPMLGAFFVEYASWRWIFYINIPICAISVVLLRYYKEEYESRKAQIDYGGALLFGIAISLLLLTTTVKSYAILYGLGGALMLAVFALYERRHASPIIPLSLLRNRQISWVNVNGFIGCVALFGTSSFVPLYLQDEGYSIFLSGVALLGMSVGWMVVSIPAGKWTLRWGYAQLLVAGNAILVLSGAMLLALTYFGGFWYAFTALLVQGLAYGLLSTVATIGSQQLVEPHEKGVSTSLSLFSRNIGTALGITIMGALMNGAASLAIGIDHLFLFGFVASLVAFLSSFMIPRGPAASGIAPVYSHTADGRRR